MCVCACVCFQGEREREREGFYAVASCDFGPDKPEILRAAGSLETREELILPLESQRTLQNSLFLGNLNLFPLKGFN